MVKNVDTKIYKGMRHEILNEDNKQEVYEDIANFFLRDIEKKGI